MSRFAEVMRRRKQERADEHDFKALAQARAYHEWSESACYRHLIESIEMELEDLNRKEAVSGDQAIQLQGERRALQRRLDALNADRRTAEQVIARHFNERAS